MDNNLVHIKTATGLEIDVDPNAYNDMELLDACYEVQENNNMLALPVVIRHLLTEPARKAMYNHVRAKHGVVRTEPLLEELMDIMGLMAAARRDDTGAAEPAPEKTPAPTPEPADVAPYGGPAAFKADCVRAGTWPAPHCTPSDNAAKASATLTPEAWDTWGGDGPAAQPSGLTCATATESSKYPPDDAE